MAGTYNIRPWLGLNLGTWTFDPVYKLSGMNALAGFDFQYPGLGLVWDILNPSTSTKIWKDPGNGNIYGVFNTYYTGKIIGVVLPYGGLADTVNPGNKLYLMCRYLQLLGIDLSCYPVNVPEKQENNDISLNCFPNPFSANATLEYTLDIPGRVTAALFQSNGRLTATLLDEVQPEGTHRLVINGEDIRDGIYFCRFMSGDKVLVKKLVRIGGQ